MDIQRLNEEIQQLLELSPEKKQWAVDTRQARYLAAQATADREKAKLYCQFSGINQIDYTVNTYSLVL